MSEGLVLPTKKVSATRVNPKRLIVYSKPKTGKTTAFAGLDNNLIIDLENGTDYVDALKIKANNLKELLDIGKQVIAAGKPYKFITIDTVTALEEMVAPLAVKKYRNTPMGKNFDGDNVITLPNGAGYLYIREAFFDILNYVDTLAEHVILSGHIKDKQVDDKGEMVMSANIDLTGKIKSLICANADAIGYMFRKGNNVILSFKTNEETTCGARPDHLRNAEIVLSEINEKGEVVTHWDEVYK
jgi:uncharacterized protein YheU (UPF0270 family)